MTTRWWIIARLVERLNIRTAPQEATPRGGRAPALRGALVRPLHGVPHGRAIRAPGPARPGAHDARRRGRAWLLAPRLHRAPQPVPRDRPRRAAPRRAS